MVWGIIAAVVLVGGYVAFKSDKSDATNNTNDVVVTENSESNTMPANGKKMAFSQFVKQGGTYKCTVNQNVGGTETKGITYISGGMINGEYSTSVQGMNITSNVIVRDGYTYSWSSMMPGAGFKSKVVANTEANNNAGMSGTYSFNAEQIGDYSCEEWSGDQSKFNLPSGITFKEM